MMNLLQILRNIWVGLIKMEQVYRKQIQHPIDCKKYLKLQYSLIYNSSIEEIEI